MEAAEPKEPTEEQKEAEVVAASGETPAEATYSRVGNKWRARAVAIGERIALRPQMKRTDPGRELPSLFIRANVEHK